MNMWNQHARWVWLTSSAWLNTCMRLCEAWNWAMLLSSWTLTPYADSKHWIATERVYKQHVQFLTVTDSGGQTLKKKHFFDKLPPLPGPLSLFLLPPYGCLSLPFCLSFSPSQSLSLCMCIYNIYKHQPNHILWQINAWSSQTQPDNFR